MSQENRTIADAEHDKDKYSSLILWGAVVVVICLVYGFTITILSYKWEEKGQFGDTFGAINALFSGLAFAGIIYTIQLQRKELGLQRKELRHTREELSRSADAQNDAQKALNEQAKMMNTTAKLNTLTAMLEHYRHISANPMGYEDVDPRKKVKWYEDKINDLLAHLASDGVDAMKPNIEPDLFY